MADEPVVAMIAAREAGQPCGGENRDDVGGGSGERRIAESVRLREVKFQGSVFQQERTPTTCSTSEEVSYSGTNQAVPVTRALLDWPADAEVSALFRADCLQG